MGSISHFQSATMDSSPFSVDSAASDELLAFEGAKLLKFYKTKPCPWYPQGKCRMGNECNWAHSSGEMRPSVDLTKTKLCDSLFKHGRCSNPKCRFAHSRDELRATSDVYKTSLCLFWMKGGCFVGANCRYAHGFEDLRTRPDTSYSNNNSTGGDDLHSLTTNDMPTSASGYHTREAEPPAAAPAGVVGGVPPPPSLIMHASLSSSRAGNSTPVMQEDSSHSFQLDCNATTTASSSATIDHQSQTRSTLSPTSRSPTELTLTFNESANQMESDNHNNSSSFYSRNPFPSCPYHHPPGAMPSSFKGHHLFTYNSNTSENSSPLGGGGAGTLPFVDSAADQQTASSTPSNITSDTNGNNNHLSKNFLKQAQHLPASKYLLNRSKFEESGCQVSTDIESVDSFTSGLQDIVKGCESDNQNLQYYSGWLAPPFHGYGLAGESFVPSFHLNQDSHDMGVGGGVQSAMSIPRNPFDDVPPRKHPNGGGVLSANLMKSIYTSGNSNCCCCTNNPSHINNNNHIIDQTPHHHLKQLRNCPLSTLSDPIVLDQQLPASSYLMRHNKSTPPVMSCMYSQLRSTAFNDISNTQAPNNTLATKSRHIPPIPPKQQRHHHHLDPRYTNTIENHHHVSQLTKPRAKEIDLPLTREQPSISGHNQKEGEPADSVFDVSTILSQRFGPPPASSPGMPVNS